MVPFIFANNIKTTLAAALSSSGTTVTLASSAGLPTIPAGSYMPLALNDSATGLVYEILYVTAISGATLTVLRGQEGTSAQTWAIGDIAFVGPTSQPFENAIAEITNAITGGGLTPTAGSTSQLLSAIQALSGAGATAQDLTASRAFGTVYTNSTLRTISVMVTTPNNSTAAWGISGFVDSLHCATSFVAASAGAATGVTLVVPPGSTYEVTQSTGTPTLDKWVEVR